MTCNLERETSENRKPGKRVAVACQGGGSHTAFTAGALKRILASDDVEIRAVSGASGGALCALLAHYGLLTGGKEEAARLLEDFWEANEASGPLQALLNDWMVQTRRAGASVGMMAAPSPFPEAAREELGRLLTDFVDFDRLPELEREREGPKLLVGAVEVVSGEHHLFDSARGEICLEAILASCAVPGLFRAEPVGGGLYWDGMFSHNPPVRDLPDTDCDELWVVQIEPSTRGTEPRTAPEIQDRRAQLEGNLSLEQELRFIETLNGLVENGSLSDTAHQRIGIRRISLDRELDSASKLDRSPDFISGLFADGEREAASLL